ncbi:precorrin-3B synthase [Lichenihabitans sp. Uapishka_5]|uniref:precorrin-3B synthase n=1 Tax=Lichenihabitans sp. Uapishka_5 TaxID=3037302 RepID=UPI0029E7EF0C|nr:precorrin-3B synthase [Lichenihabitans sp. Uapishka_5]MDX7953556.1 precorrin-3B synthase [Lichenihabitans sp. Uapishka_5]
MSGPATVGWCPGALRPMASGDGLILRVKPRGGRLGFDQAAAVADLATRFGNGHLDLTGRANLQIRGARPDSIAALTAGLRQAGLLDASEAVETLRNIVASPLAGHDPEGVEVRPFLAALEAGLTAGAAAGLALPAKWSFVVDGGGRLPLAGVSADMRFRFDRSGPMRLGLADAWAEPFAAPPDLPPLLAAVAALVAAQPESGRMAALLSRLGAAPVFAALGLRLAAAPVAEPPPVESADLFGLTEDVVALAPPFGGLEAETLTEIVVACRAAGAADLRLTPWRVLLVVGVADRAGLVARLGRLGLIVAADDPCLAVTACVGAPACHRATVATRTDAAMLAGRLDGTGSIHVSGCIKGCGRPADAAWTLVARDGRYDAHRGGDAHPRITGLSSTGAANWLSRAERARVS